MAGAFPLPPPHVPLLYLRIHDFAGEGRGPQAGLRGGNFCIEEDSLSLQRLSIIAARIPVFTLFLPVVL